MEYSAHPSSTSAVGLTSPPTIVQKPIERPENNAINALRAAAALLVVVSHLRTLFFIDYSNAEHNKLNNVFYFASSLGHPAVIVFFVMSGYWVGGSVLRQIQAGQFTWRRHLSQRLTRLWVVLIPALLVTAIVDAVGRSMRPLSDVYRGSPAYYGVAPIHPNNHDGWIVLLGNAGFLQSIRVPTFGTNGPLWSLAYEAVYYALFPLACLLLLRSSPLAGRLLCGLLFTAIALLAGKTVLALGLPWLLGVAIAWQQKRIRILLSEKWTGWMQAMGIVGLIAGFVVASASDNAWLSAAAISLPSGILLSSLLSDTRGPVILRRCISSFSSIAGSSYSLYVTHCPVLVLLTAILVPRATDRWSLNPMSAAAAVGLVGTCMLTALLFAKLTENQTGRLRKALQGGRRRTRVIQ